MSAAAWERYSRGGRASLSSSEEVAEAVRHSLRLFEEANPGRAVEVRVVPFAAVSVLAGAKHRRGTPPAVVEMDAATWLALATGRLSWQDAEQSGAVDATGEKSDLSDYLPLC